MNSADAAAARTRDPVHSDPDKYTVVHENDQVRVLEYRDKPGAKTTMHSHPEFILCVLAPFKRKLSFPDGNFKIREFRAGEVVPMKAQTHLGENVGTTDTHVLLVELKGSKHGH